MIGKMYADTLWKQLEDKATALEREREASRREKDSALTIAAAHDLDYYRIHGHVPGMCAYTCRACVSSAFIGSLVGTVGC